MVPPFRGLIDGWLGSWTFLFYSLFYLFSEYFMPKTVQGSEYHTRWHQLNWKLLSLHVVHIKLTMEANPFNCIAYSKEQILTLITSLFSYIPVHVYNAPLGAGTSFIWVVIKPWRGIVAHVIEFLAGLEEVPVLPILTILMHPFEMYLWLKIAIPYHWLRAF